MYDKITGIWQERAKQLEQVRNERLKVREQIKIEREKLRQRIRFFKADKQNAIKKALGRQTASFERRLLNLRAREKKIEAEAAARLAKATKAVHQEAQKSVKEQLTHFKENLRKTAQEKIRQARELIKSGTEKKYQNLRNSFNAAILQMKSQDRKMQDQQDRIKELERQLKRQTTPSVEGLLYEETLLRELKKKFPEDIFQHTGKGGDIIQSVAKDKKVVGTIMYECKRVQHYYSSHVNQALLAKVKRKADFAILVTNAMKKGTQGFFAEKSILIVHPAGVIALASILRTQIVRIADLKLGQLERDRAVKQTLEYLQGPEFANSMEGIVGETISLHGELIEEIKRHVAAWKRRYSSYAKINAEATKVEGTTNAMLCGKEPEKTIQAKPFPALVELPMIEA
jgi:hypothetical protein